VPRTRATAVETRSTQQVDYGVDVGIQQKLEGEGAEDVDPLLYLAEQISSYWDGRSLATPASTCIAVDSDPIYDPEHLAQMRQFTGVLNLTFRTME
jgi:hypothetical protein